MRPPESLDEPASLSFADLIKQQQTAATSRAGGRGDLVLAYGSCLIRKYKQKLGNALWGVLETVYVQALEYRQDRLARFCLQTLQQRWPGSARVKRLEGLALEAQAHWDAALARYEEMLEQHPHDPLTRKRVVAALKNRGRLSECIQMLFLHLDEFGTDAEAWQELGTIFAGEGRLAQAAFCFEELLVHEPLNILFLSVYAELQYGLHRCRLSRQYAAYLVSLHPRNIRAFWTLIIASRQTIDDACGKDRITRGQEKTKKTEKEKSASPAPSSAVDEEVKDVLHLSLGALRRLGAIYEEEIAKADEEDGETVGRCVLDALFGEAALRRLESHRRFFVARAAGLGIEIK
ncbi:tetratricopeptide repeat-containing protein [Besnoitia besnoiti]|uniref:ER membrane protein complex subunit 2 n=1 Tax=Besnoitia besnoiti TaxID=94643 RepID=A0A2A9MCN7_BESBE|nr:tetratricopeptide repeat-containing protein [Besnoitia besnoiti]PFH33357.1 tetratricopeptide repeat-containing protein [Besnoitia besnoiti]